MTTTTIADPREVLVSFIQAMNAEDYETARTYVTDDMVFDGVLGSRNGATAYFKDMKNMKLKYDVKKTFADADDVCLLYDINMGEKTIFTCGWYHLTNGKISFIKVVFDPRPILEGAAKN